MKKSTINYSWLPFLVAAFLFSFDLEYNLVGVTFLILISQSALGLVFSFSRSTNLLSVYFIFTLVFFSLLPWLHYSTNWVIWRSSRILDSTYIVVNVTILLANAALFISYVLSSKKNNAGSTSVAPLRNKRASVFVLLSMSALSCTLVFYLNNFSVSQLLLRGLADVERIFVIESSSLSLLLEMIARLTPVFCFYYVATQLKDWTITKWLFFLLMLISVFPTGVARYMVAFVYIPLALLFVPVMRNASLFAATLMLSLLFLFPFLDQFRNFSGIENLSILPSVEFFYASHFDAYENFASVVESSFVTYGYQLMGSLLFFVPRVFWPDKPVGSGYEMAGRLGYEFNNISMPFLGEGYVNFGFTGVLLFAILIGSLMAKMDCRFSTEKGTNAKPDYLSAIYYFMLGAVFFLLRGDLLSSFAYISAGLVVALLVRRVMNFTNTRYFRP